MLHLALSALFLLALFKGSYTYIYENSGSDDDTLFHETKDVQLTSQEPFESQTNMDSKDCYRTCYRYGSRCQSINILKSGSVSECRYYESSTGTFLPSPGNLFVSRKPPTCSGYCENLQHLDLCGKCKCVNNCGMKIPYHCNCTNELEPKKDCTEVLQSGFNKSGVYKINPGGGGPFPVFCEMKGDTSGKISAWITMLRRLKEDTDFLKKRKDDYENGFGKVQHDDFFLGLNHVRRIAHPSKDMMMRIEMYDENNKEVAGTYSEFSVNGQQSEVRYKTFNSTRGDLGEILFRRAGGGNLAFTRCKDGKFWWRSCRNGDLSADGRKYITDAGRIRLLLRSRVAGETSRNPVSNCNVLQEKKYPNGYYWINSEQIFCDMEYPEGPGKSQRSAIKSCKWAIDKYTELKSGYYWTVLSELTNLYCDMDVEGGGWTMIGKFLLNAPMGNDYRKDIQADITALERVETDRFLLSTPGLRKLDAYIIFSQIRIYCKKSNHQRVFHIYTENNDEGKAVVKYFKGMRDKKPKACGSFRKMKDDSSLLADKCDKISFNTHKSNIDSGDRLWNRPFWYPGNTILLHPKLCCDDAGTDGNEGEWKYFVR